MKIFLPSYIGIHNKPMKRIPINQPGFNGKWEGFFRSSFGEIVVFVGEEAEAPSVFFWRRRVVPSWKGHQRFFWGGDIVSVWGVTPGSLTYPLKMDSRKTVWEGNFSGAVLNIGRYSGVHVTQQMFFSKTKALTRISCFFDLNRREMDAVRAMLVNIATFALLPKFSGKSIASWQVEVFPRDSRGRFL